MMAHRDRLNALAAAELGRARTAEMGRARPAETQVEVSLTPATKRDGSSPAVRVTVNDICDNIDKDTEVSLSDDSFDDNGRQASKYGREEKSSPFCPRFRAPALPLGCIAFLILLGLGAIAAAITLSVIDRNSSSTTTNGAHRPWYWPDNGRPLIENTTLTSKPTPTPTLEPTQAPTRSPVTDAPTLKPTPMPSRSPVTDAPTRLPTRAPYTSQHQQVEHVIHITVDGLRPDYMNGPNFDRLKSEGACTLNARSDLASTKTLPNHIGMFTGLTVADHDYSANEDSGYKLVDATGQGYENIFDLVKEAGGTTSIYTSKRKFALLNRSWSVDKFVLIDRISSVVESFLEGMNDETYNYSFLHIESPDKAGHDDDDGASHWKYRNAVADADAYLGQVFDLIESNVELRDNTAIILTADHGFQDRGTHLNNELLENYRVPFCTFGPGVVAGADLIELNSRLNGGVVVDPGLSRGSGRAIRNTYAGVLAASWLGLRPRSGPLSDQYLRY